MKSEGQSDKLALTAEQLNVKQLFMGNISHLTAPQLCSSSTIITLISLGVIHIQSLRDYFNPLFASVVNYIEK